MTLVVDSSLFIGCHLHLQPSCFNINSIAKNNKATPLLVYPSFTCQPPQPGAYYRTLLISSTKCGGTECKDSTITNIFIL